MVAAARPEVHAATAGQGERLHCFESLCGVNKETAAEHHFRANNKPRNQLLIYFSRGTSSFYRRLSSRLTGCSSYHDSEASSIGTQRGSGSRALSSNEHTEGLWLFYCFIFCVPDILKCMWLYPSSNGAVEKRLKKKRAKRSRAIPRPGPFLPWGKYPTAVAVDVPTRNPRCPRGPKRYVSG